MNIELIFLRAISISAVVITLFGCGSEGDDNSQPEISRASPAETVPNVADAPIKSDIRIALNNADSALGERFFIQCKACHTVDDGADNLIGPNLWALVDRAAGKQENFQYSESLANADFIWSLEKLDQFLINPNALIPDTTMIFNGIADDKMRHDVLAYLVEATTEN